MANESPDLGYIHILNGNEEVVTDFSGSASAIVAGEAHMGSVGGSVASAIVALARPANTTPYTALDAIGAILAITNATNASPIVVTCDTHTLVDGDPVTISGVVGNTAANVSCYAKVAGYSSTTFAMYSDKALATPIAGNGAWSSGGSVAKVLRFTGMGRVLGGSGYIVKAQLWTGQKTCVASIKLHLFNAPPAGILDNIAYGSLIANRTNHVGKVAFPGLTTEDPTASDCASALAIPDGSGNNLPLKYICAATDTDLYGIAETITAFTPAANQLFYVKLTAETD